MKRKATASEEPTSAIQTTETAAGTRTMKEAKWSLARRKPKADDFIDVSMATVRHVVSEYLSGLHAKYAARPPKMWRAAAAAWSFRPAARMGAEH